MKQDAAKNVRMRITNACVRFYKILLNLTNLMRIIIQKFLDILTDIHGRVELLVVAPISNQILFEGLDLTQPLPQYHYISI